ncbi:hypothetical protein DEU56DRAFT_750354 [Suillus clintonianus]|uniref:uncharacterized protein n=1 Tax=Suillus clintonianus TaxID=1904413 RepID=UPI001B860872|nr:uncharacterized protein DEU56DRAFT_750354 [Suillus clintonianus]KAG2157187.1 hypothetical protein DEU56DRAFT_750354 [Suillus clintonianus]
MAKHHLHSNSTNTSIPKPISSASTICPSVHTNTLQTPIIHGAGPITTVMSMPTSKITAITLSYTDLEKIELLDRGQNNWGMWSAKIRNYLLLKHGGGYLLGVIPCPNNILDPAGASTWDLNNLLSHHGKQHTQWITVSSSKIVNKHVWYYHRNLNIVVAMGGWWLMEKFILDDLQYTPTSIIVHLVMKDRSRRFKTYTSNGQIITLMETKRGWDALQPITEALTTIDMTMMTPGGIATFYPEMTLEWNGYSTHKGNKLLQGQCFASVKSNFLTEVTNFGFFNSESQGPTVRTGSQYTVIQRLQ